MVQAGNYETIYVNCPPILFGNARGVKLIPAMGRNASASGRAGKTSGDDFPTEIGEANY